MLLVNIWRSCECAPQFRDAEDYEKHIHRLIDYTTIQP